VRVPPTTILALSADDNDAASTFSAFAASVITTLASAASSR